MARPHIEFIHEQVLPWSEGLPGGGRPGVQVRTLSMDDETGSLTAVIRYPPGWSRAEAEHLLADEEFVVLRGSLEVNGVVYDELAYGFFPAAHVRQRASSPSGALVLTFFEGEPRAVAGEPSQPGRRDRLIERIRALDGDWGGNFHPLFPPGAGRKWLRREPEEGETWILGTMPLRSARRPEKHPVIEEMFLLSGEVVSPLGVMHAGAYFWRPAEIWHGPFGTKTGALYLFRTRGGPLSTVFTETEVDFDWSPKHRPVLTPELEKLGAQPYDVRPAF